jgi:hypothetical protein
VLRQAGRVLLTFDNSYSMLTSKTIRYSVTVLDELQQHHAAADADAEEEAKAEDA